MKENDIFVCMACETKFKLNDLKDPHWSLNFCPKCKEEKGETRVLLSLKEFQKEKRRQELAKRIYCRICGHISPIEEFAFNGPPEDKMRERICPQFCPQCGSDGGVNMARVKMCKKCDEVPAAIGDSWCKHCADEYEAVCQAAYEAEKYPVEYD